VVTTGDHRTIPLVQLGVLSLATCLLIACSDTSIPDTSDASQDGAEPACSPDCTSGQLCFASGPPDAAPPSSCQFVPTACMSNPSCACLGPTMCPGAGGYTCNYDALAGYVVLQCAN
jgi:hypothetical protein